MKWISTKRKKKRSTNSPEQDSCTNEFYQSFKEKLTPELLKLLQKKTEEEGTLPNNKISIILIPKLDKNITKKKKITATTLDEDRCKSPQWNISKLKSIR